MEANTERECSALGGLFQQIILDMKTATPLWEDLVVKATKLHTCLRATINAISAYLDAFQKIADAATNTRGATKEIGTALTRICLRHRAVEARMKTFSSAIIDCLVTPLQEKIEDWKKAVINLDKEHAKVSLGIVVLLYLTTSAHCEKKISLRSNHTMGYRHVLDQLVFNETIEKSKSEQVKIVRWPFDQKESIYVITWYEAIDRSEVCGITTKAGGQTFKYLELKVESEIDKECAFQLIIYGYSSLLL